VSCDVEDEVDTIVESGNFFISGSTYLMNWYDASAYCNSWGGELASILSEEDAYLYRDLITDVNVLTWLGMNDIDEEG
jgi:hypothetical protein